MKSKRKCVMFFFSEFDYLVMKVIYIILMHLENILSYIYFSLQINNASKRYESNVTLPIEGVVSKKESPLGEFR